jgi:site-specific recombinase XerC
LDGYDFDLNLAAPMSFDFGRGRGNKRRGLGLVSPTNVALYDALVQANQRRKTAYLIEYRGKKVNKVDLTDAYRRAGIKGATQHTLKHTCCSWLFQAGQSYANIAKLVGTSARTIEKHYGHLSPAHLATVGDVLTV